MKSEPLSLEVVVERKSQTLPRYAIVPDVLVQPWALQETTVVDGTVNGEELGRRSLKRWDEDRWFIVFPEPLARVAGFDTGDRVRLTLRVASEELPKELDELLEEEPRARECWERLTASRRRLVREHVLSAKRSSTRTRRARRALLGAGA